MAVYQLTATVWQEGDQCVSRCPELGVASCGGTADEALSALQEAVELYLENAKASVNNEMVSLVKDYATKGGMLSEDDAGRMLQRRFDLEQRRLDMKKRYVGEFKSALPGRKVARFYQLDRAIDMLIDIAVMSEIPLATGEE